MCGYWHKMHPMARTSVLAVLKIYNAFKVHLILRRKQHDLSFCAWKSSSNIRLSKDSQNSEYPWNSQVFFITGTASANGNATSAFFSFEIRFLEKSIPRKILKLDGTSPLQAVAYSLVGCGAASLWGHMKIFDENLLGHHENGIVAQVALEQSLSMRNFTA